MFWLCFAGIWIFDVDVLVFCIYCSHNILYIHRTYQQIEREQKFTGFGTVRVRITMMIMRLLLTCLPRFWQCEGSHTLTHTPLIIIVWAGLSKQVLVLMFCMEGINIFYLLEVKKIKGEGDYEDQTWDPTERSTIGWQRMIYHWLAEGEYRRSIIGWRWDNGVMPLGRVAGVHHYL